MIITVLSICAILFLALQCEDKLKIPSPVGLIGLSFAFHLLFGDLFMLTGDAEHFAALVILLLPILLIGDSLELKVEDLKEHGLSLFYLAVVAVSLSVITALLIGDTLFGQYDLSFAAIILLFAMVLATDPVSVVSIFSKFELPHRLKILCEGESLFNDATALIVFVFIGLYALDGGDITFGYVAQTSLVVVGGSAVLGVLVGYIGLMAMKTTENRIAELLVLILTGYGAFELSEHFYVILNLFGGHSHMHLSGILACIFSTVTVHHFLSKSVAYDDMRLEKEEQYLERESASEKTSRSLVHTAIQKIKATVEERDRHLRTKEDVQLLAIVANTMLFVAMAEIVDIDLLWKYSTEIMVMFLATTVIRAAMMAKFAIITNQTDKMTNVNFRWWGVLTFAGIKGGLSVVMLMMIPAGFEHLEMFKAIVVGVIMLSTFIYSAILLGVIGKNKAEFSQELADEGGHH
ncbi:monovalent cation:H+ antiporter, CPA1 family [Mariprofundus micogutta]|uniref:Monovalent cation:H+ antiporter, CPA1 family n=1 Tax=Mariprofundus micogutta TaxID=1921010 RepID=A0A1L8CPF7_9PROT|nr:cation:proton antiporter [Mariprofundus micogutta]GAV20800.1 monovalent cation:H+ antiporter, CPA1 family [Mariprofundus micogutta]